MQNIIDISLLGDHAGENIAYSGVFGHCVQDIVFRTLCSGHCVQDIVFDILRHVKLKNIASCNQINE